jgi:pyrroline-5-carboxylate reductase
MKVFKEDILMEKIIGFIGCGNMSKAIIGGLVKSGKVKGENIIASDYSQEGLAQCEKQYGIKTALKDNCRVAKESDIIILAVKPNVYGAVIEEIKNSVKEDVVIVTIAAGITIDFVEKAFGRSMKIIRTMPNTAALVGESVTAVCKNSIVTDEEVQEVKDLLTGIGMVEEVSENLIDGVIAVSGSSPAYMYMFLEALGDGAVLAGLPRDKAYRMAAQAMLGAAKMYLETGKHPGELKDMVCSPGGTTIEAVYSLEKSGFRGAVIESMVKCIEKAEKLRS